MSDAASPAPATAATPPRARTVFAGRFSGLQARVELAALRRVRRLRNTKTKPQVVFIHGGGFIEGFDDNHQRMVWALDKLVGTNVLCVEYPVGGTAEEIRPVVAAAVRQAAAVHGPVILVGDSAGANLAAAAAAQHPEAVRGVVLICPWLDLTLSEVPAGATDLLLDVKVLRRAASGFAGGRDLNDPDVSPLWDSRPLPPTLVISGGRDILAPDAARLATRPEVTHLHVGSGFHDFPAAAVSPSGLVAWRAVRDFVSHLGAPAADGAAGAPGAQGLFHD
ncbi:alpha/beta fold hydrolase [Corynebacterium sp. 13CS0277]|uniref:alpha/beta fold hydrolase n=1 Tax=Corynebacterium sp. 13CS0277 TaxID=2071994 RepID=UPI001305038B|nr:alpha/beta hydrolase [Corynebacterium sp. 13CS0277]